MSNVDDDGGGGDDDTNNDNDEHQQSIRFNKEHSNENGLSVQCCFRCAQ